MSTTFCTLSSSSSLPKSGEENESSQTLNEKHLCSKCNDNTANTSNWSNPYTNHSVKKESGEFVKLQMSQLDHAYSLGSQVAINSTVESDNISNSCNSNNRHSSRSDNTQSALSGETDDKMNDAVSRNLNSHIEPELNVLHKWDNTKENECDVNNDNDVEEKNRNHAPQCVHCGAYYVDKVKGASNNKNNKTNIKKTNKCDNDGEVMEYVTPHSKCAENKNENEQNTFDTDHSHGQSEGFLIAATNTEFHKLPAQLPTSLLSLSVQNEHNVHVDNQNEMQYNRNKEEKEVKTLPAEMETPCSDYFDKTCHTMEKAEKQFCEVSRDELCHVVTTSPHQAHRHLTSTQLERMKNNSTSTSTPPPYTELQKDQQQEQQHQSLSMLSSLAPANAITKTPTPSKASTSNTTHSAHRLLTQREIEEMMQSKNSQHESPSVASKNESYNRSNVNANKMKREITQEPIQAERPCERTPHYQKETGYLAQHHCLQTVLPQSSSSSLSSSSPTLLLSHMPCAMENKNAHNNNNNNNISNNNTINITKQGTMKPTPHKVNIKESSDTMSHANALHKDNMCHEVTKPTPQPHVTKMAIIPPPAQPLLPSRNPHVQYNYSLPPNEMQSHAFSNKACNCDIAQYSNNKGICNSDNICSEYASHEIISTMTDKINNSSNNSSNKCNITNAKCHVHSTITPHVNLSERFNALDRSECQHIHNDIHVGNVYGTTLNECHSNNNNNNNSAINTYECNTNFETDEPERTSLPYYQHTSEHQAMPSSQSNTVNQNTNRNQSNNNDNKSNHEQMSQSNVDAGQLGCTARPPPPPPPPFYAPPPPLPLSSEILSAPESIKPMQTQSPLFPFASASGKTTSWSTTNRTNSAITNSKNSGENYVNDNNHNVKNLSYHSNSNSNSETKYTRTNKNTNVHNNNNYFLSNNTTNTNSSQHSSSHVQTEKWNSDSTTQTTLPSPPQLPLPVRESSLCPSELPLPSMLSLPIPPPPPPPPPPQQQQQQSVPPFQFYPPTASSLPLPMPSNTFQPSFINFPKSALTPSLPRQPSEPLHLLPPSLSWPYYYHNTAETMPPPPQQQLPTTQTQTTSFDRYSSTNMQGTHANYQPMCNTIITTTTTTKNMNYYSNTDIDHSSCEYGNIYNDSNNNRQMYYQSKYTSQISPSKQLLQNESYDTRNNNNNNNNYNYQHDDNNKKVLINNISDDVNSNYCSAQTQIASSFNTAATQHEEASQCINNATYGEGYYYKEPEHAPKIAHENTSECKKELQPYVQKYNATNHGCNDDNSNLSHSPNEMVNCTSSYMPCDGNQTGNISVGANELSPMTNNYLAPTNTISTGWHNNQNSGYCYNKVSETGWNQNYNSRNNNTTTMYANSTANSNNKYASSYTAPFTYNVDNYNANMNKTNMKIGNSTNNNNDNNANPLQYPATNFALVNNAIIHKNTVSNSNVKIGTITSNNRQSAGNNDTNRRRHKISHDNTPQNLKYSQTDPFSMYKHNKMLEQEASKVQQAEEQQVEEQQQQKQQQQLLQQHY